MKTILVIDDDAALRLALSAFMRQQGWQVIDTGDGDTGLALARKHLPQVILCDLLMPGTNGFRVCAAVRGERTLRYSLLIAMSGRHFENTRQTALEAGADEFLLKPIEFTQLLSLVERVGGPSPPPPPSPPDVAKAVDSEPAFVRFWGVRGSIPVPGPATLRHGGNTACVEFRGAGEIVILDSGTGIRPLGEALSAEFKDQPLQLTLLITHSHWDHVQGFPFFKPAYDAANHIRILGFEGAGEGLAGIFSGQMESPYFPIGLGQLPVHLVFEELRSMEFEIGRVQLRAAFANHPGVCVSYRLNTRRGSVAYLPDHEPFHRTRGQSLQAGDPKASAVEFARVEDDKIVQFLRHADVLILDAQFDAEEYAVHVGWGHSSVDDAVDIALRAQVKQLFLFHHDPAHDDAKIEQMVQHARRLVAKSGQVLEVHAAREGLKCELGPKVKAAKK
jgi:phosphoribosyl 1,2-cyclic phosphodiesterase/ActR/RegA family two-component response regulator